MYDLATKRKLRKGVWAVARHERPAVPGANSRNSFLDETYLELPKGESGHKSGSFEATVSRRGRPNLMKKRILPNLVYIEGWIRRGFTEQSIARQLRVSTNTFAECKRLYPELQLTIERGREDSTVLVENALFREAIGYETEEVTQEIAGYDQDGEPLVTKEVRKKVRVRPSVPAQMFYLANRMPQRWASAKTTGGNVRRLDPAMDKLGAVFGEKVGMISDPTLIAAAAGLATKQAQLDEGLRGVLGIKGGSSGEGNTGTSPKGGENGALPTGSNSQILSLSKLNEEELEGLDRMISKALGGSIPADNPPSDQSDSDSDSGEIADETDADSLELDETFEE